MVTWGRRTLLVAAAAVSALVLAGASACTPQPPPVLPDGASVEMITYAPPGATGDPHAVTTSVLHVDADGTTADLGPADRRAIRLERALSPDGSKLLLGSLDNASVFGGGLLHVSVYDVTGADLSTFDPATSDPSAFPLLRTIDTTVTWMPFGYDGFLPVWSPESQELVVGTDPVEAGGTATGTMVHIASVDDPSGASDRTVTLGVVPVLNTVSSSTYLPVRVTDWSSTGRLSVVATQQQAATTMIPGASYAVPSIDWVWTASATDGTALRKVARTGGFDGVESWFQMIFVNQGAPPLPVDHMAAVPIFSPNGTHLLLPQGYTDDQMYMMAPVIVADEAGAARALIDVPPLVPWKILFGQQIPFGFGIWPLAWR